MREDDLATTVVEKLVFRAMTDTSPPPISYDAGFIVLSYFISLTGCVTTLELLQRRTSVRGAYNWYLLVASSISMGAVGIWCMHFIGNRAIILQHGDHNYSIKYNAGFTALSFFLPIAVLLCAFHLLGLKGTAHGLYLALAGFLTGTAVCAMHYVGNFGIANYNCGYDTAHVVGAAIIAVFASLIALSVFFRLRQTWTDVWWKRVFCAALLAGAVSGMHWTAALGTVYYPRNRGSLMGGGSRVSTVVVAAILSVVACLALLAIAIVTNRRLFITRSRAQEVVLACVYYDDDGRVMVTADGALPHEKVTSRFVQKTFGDDELIASHPTFMWCFEATRNWSALKELLTCMPEQKQRDSNSWKHRSNSNDFADGIDELSMDFGMVFKQLFCTAARRLADQIHEPIQTLGVLFEEPFETGLELKKATLRSLDELRKLFVSHGQADIESLSEPVQVFGKGRYMFLIRKLDQSQSDKLASRGYRFGAIPYVSEGLARNMQVTRKSLSLRLERMLLCASREHLFPPGVHLAAFLLKPGVVKDFDVLVPGQSQNQLPLATLPTTTLTAWQLDALRRFDEWSLRDIFRALANEFGDLEMENMFRWQLHSTLTSMVDRVGDANMMMRAKFSAKPVRAPCRMSGAPDGPKECTIYSVRLICTIHTAPPKDELTFVPMTFFHAQQVVEYSGSGQQAFQRKVLAEFGRLIDQAQTDEVANTKANGGRLSAASKLTTRMPSTRRGSKSTTLKSVVGSTTNTVGPSPRIPELESFGVAEVGITEEDQTNILVKHAENVGVAEMVVEEDEFEHQHEQAQAGSTSASTSPVHVHGSDVSRQRAIEMQQIIQNSDYDQDRGSFVSDLFALFKVDRLGSAIGTDRRQLSPSPELSRIQTQ